MVKDYARGDDEEDDRNLDGVLDPALVNDEPSPATDNCGDEARVACTGDIGQDSTGDTSSDGYLGTHGEQEVVGASTPALVGPICASLGLPLSVLYYDSRTWSDLPGPVGCRCM